MQHTLLPAHQHATLRHEYHLRVLITIFFALSLAGVVGVASLLPAYLRGSLEERLQLDSIASLEKDKGARGAASIEQELKTDKILLATLTDGADTRLLSAEIQDFVTLRGSVKITSFTVQRGEDDSISIVLQGVAPTREALLAFKNRIEEHGKGTTATLPISQLAKSTNIQFSIQIIEPKP